MYIKKICYTNSLNVIHKNYLQENDKNNVIIKNFKINFFSEKNNIQNVYYILIKHFYDLFLS